MDALREYSPSDEEIQGNGDHIGGKASQQLHRRPQTAPQKHDHHRNSPSSPDRSPSPKRKHPLSSKPSHPPRRHSPPPVRRRSRSPHSNRGGSSHQDRDIRRHPRHNSSRHQRRSRSPPKRHGNSSNSRHHEDERTGSKSGANRIEEDVQKTNRPQWSNDETLTPEQKLEQALAASRANKPKTVPGVPSYINTTVINPKHFQTIQQKRKLLWGKKEKETKNSWNKWESAAFEGDNQGETQSKFRRLMGIKDGVSEGSDSAIKSNKLLDDLEAQYETSRFMTHLAKGAGLGYGSGAQITQNKVNPNDTDDINESHAHR